MNFNYRIATPADKDELQQLGIAAFGQYKNTLTQENWEKLYAVQTGAHTYSDLLAKATCFVCETDEQLVGMAYLIASGNPTAVFQANWCYLRMIGVHPDFMGNGIGRKLTLQCITRARQTGEKVMALHTSEFMDAARHIYEKIGFQKTKELEPGFGKRYWLYLMEL